MGFRRCWDEAKGLFLGSFCSEDIGEVWEARFSILQSWAFAGIFKPDITDFNRFSKFLVTCWKRKPMLKGTSVYLIPNATRFNLISKLYDFLIINSFY